MDLMDLMEPDGTDGTAGGHSPGPGTAQFVLSCPQIPKSPPIPPLQGETRRVGPVLEQAGVARVEGTSLGVCVLGIAGECWRVSGRAGGALRRVPGCVEAC